MLRCKCWDSFKANRRFSFIQCISNRENTWVKNADNIPGICLLDMFSLLCHHLLWLCKTNLFATLHMHNFHACLKLTGADTHKSNSVTMGLIHICLNLKYKCRKFIREWVYHLATGCTRQRRCCHIQEMLQKGFYTKVCQCRTKKYRRKLSGTNLFQIKGIACSIQQFNFVN